MSAPLAATRALARARRTAAGIVVAFGLPWLAALAALLRGPWATQAAFALLAAATLLLALLAAWRARRLDRAWLVRRLDARLSALQDSSDLLFAPPASLTPVARLQQARVAQALAQAPVDVKPAWPWRRLAANAAAAALVAAVAALWPAEQRAPARDAAGDFAPRAAARRQVEVEVRPPAYTGRAARRVDTLDLQVEQDAEVAWTLRFSPVPAAARLRFVDGGALELAPSDGAWRAARAFARSTLYRVETDGAGPGAADALHRLEVVPDRAPEIEVRAPERTLTVLDAASRHWTLAFEARDDHGLGAAQLELTLAQGSGEQVEVSERRVALRGSGVPTRQQFEHHIDLAALGFAPGDDLIARIVLRDRREPEPNLTRSASFILRWPPESGGEGSGVEGLVQKAMPAYFRSQRQIIIDTEALLKRRAALTRDEFVAQADAIGADQRLLRLRYGQFLGEEAQEVESPDAAHDDGAPPGPGTDAAALIAEAGHLHDIAEAATLLDPQTRALLRLALRAMWQAEGELRTGRPDAALPHEYRALEQVKRVQQSNRIYLARVGLELPALDPARRLTGSAPPPGVRGDPLGVPDPAPSAAESVWSALQAGAAALPVEALLAELAAEPADPATLALLEALDAVRTQPDCRRCRERLAARLWPRLRIPAAPPPGRAAPDASGRAYLEALTPEGAP